ARGTYVELARLSLEDPGLFPFGIDAAGETIFAWDTAAARADGELAIVVWMNEIGERVASFPHFLELVLEMLGAEIAERRPAARTAPARPRARQSELFGSDAA